MEMLLTFLFSHGFKGQVHKSLKEAHLNPMSSSESKYVFIRF